MYKPCDWSYLGPHHNQRALRSSACLFPKLMFWDRDIHNPAASGNNNPKISNLVYNWSIWGKVAKYKILFPTQELLLSIMGRTHRSPVSISPGSLKKPAFHFSLKLCKCVKRKSTWKVLFVFQLRGMYECIKNSGLEYYSLWQKFQYLSAPDRKQLFSRRDKD